MSIIDKLRKLRAKSESSACTEQEAQVYAEKLQSLLAQHNLSMKDVQDKEADYIEDRRIVKYSCAWRKQLGESVGRFMGAAFSFTVGTDYMSYIGLPHHTEAAWELFLFLIDSSVSISRARFPSDSKSARRAEKGVALGLCYRLQTMRNQLPEARALVPVEHANAQAAQERMLGELTVKSAKLGIDSKETYAGYLLADSIEIQKGVDK